MIMIHDAVTILLLLLLDSGNIWGFRRILLHHHKAPVKRHAELYNRVEVESVHVLHETGQRAVKKVKTSHHTVVKLQREGGFTTVPVVTVLT